MDRRSLFVTAGALAAVSAAPRMAVAAAPKTFVLVHGAWHGGWCWCWCEVASILRGRGLVGHSFGGSSISGVADRMRDRIRQLVYLDAVMLENGQSVFTHLLKDVVEARTKAAQETSSGLSIPAPPPAAFGITDAAQAQSVASRLTPHPLHTFMSPLKLASKVGNGLPASYIICTDPIYKALEKSHNWAKTSGWKMMEIKTGHDAMIIAPQRLADLVDAEAA